MRVRVRLMDAAADAQRAPAGCYELAVGPLYQRGSAGGVQLARAPPAHLRRKGVEREGHGVLVGCYTRGLWTLVAGYRPAGVCTDGKGAGVQRSPHQGPVGAPDPPAAVSGHQQHRYVAPREVRRHQPRRSVVTPAPDPGIDLFGAGYFFALAGTLAFRRRG